MKSNLDADIIEKEARDILAKCPRPEGDHKDQLTELVNKIVNQLMSLDPRTIDSCIVLAKVSDDDKTFFTIGGIVGNTVELEALSMIVNARIGATIQNEMITKAIN